LIAYRRNISVNRLGILPFWKGRIWTPTIPASQDTPYTLSDDDEDGPYFIPVNVSAVDDEVEVSEDLGDRRSIYFRDPPERVVRLREEVGAREGLLVKWCADKKNENGTWSLDTTYDPESKKWRGYMTAVIKGGMIHHE
jgi:hypothetical protein